MLISGIVPTKRATNLKYCAVLDRTTTLKDLQASYAMVHKYSSYQNGVCFIVILVKF